MRVVLLPGLDGTGILFDVLVERFPSWVDFVVFSLDDIRGNSYSEQAFEICQALTDEHVLIVAESYSGRIAYELCDILGSRLKGIVFLASFISKPSFVSRFSSIIPLVLIKKNHISKFFLHVFGFNFTGNRDVVEPVFNSLDKADKIKLKRRLKNIATLTDPKKIYELPVAYVQPDRDFLVGKKSIKTLCKVFVNTRLVTLSGGHFIAQSNPVGCARVICDLLSAD